MLQIMRLPCLLAAALAVPAALAAQTDTRAAADSGRFVILRKGDTVATESFTRTPAGITGTIDIRNRLTTSQHYSAVVGPDATVPLVEVTVFQKRYAAQPRTERVQAARVIFREDSVAVDDVSNRGLQTRVFGTHRGAVPYLGLSFALLEQAVRRARSLPGDPVSVPFFNLGGSEAGGGQTLDGTISKLGGDSLNLAIGKVEFHLHVDRSARLLGARIPSQDVVADRVGS